MAVRSSNADPSPRVQVPSAQADRPRWNHVGILAAIGFIAGVARRNRDILASFVRHRTHIAPRATLTVKLATAPSISISTQNWQCES